MRVFNRTFVAIAFFTSLIASVTHARDPRPDVLPDDRRAVVQVALLLDTSNSMDGLINQARTQLWTIVNEFSRCKRDGLSPRLQVALYEYGNDGLSVTDGYVRQVVPLTTDLDLLSEKLFALKTNGGSEYCGQVISVATRGLDWSSERTSYKAIFIAGNEPFTQGNTDYKSACAGAIGRGIVVNTIHCGPEGVGRSGFWDDGAKRGEGRFLNIDQDRVYAAVVAPQDEEIRKLSSELNTTYLPYGDLGKVAASRQAAQDGFARDNASAGSDVQRAVAKSSSNYVNAKWDLVDAVKEKAVDLDKVDAKDLPASVAALPAGERRQYVEKEAARRTEIQQKIQTLNDARAKFVSEQTKTSATGPDTLDSAVVKALREQLVEKGFDAAGKN